MVCSIYPKTSHQRSRQEKKIKSYMHLNYGVSSFIRWKLNLLKQQINLLNQLNRYKRSIVVKRRKSKKQ